MSRRFSFHQLLTVVVVFGILAGLTGCSGKGSVSDPTALPSILFKSLKTLQYDSTIPITIRVDSISETNASLVFVFQKGDQNFKPMTPAPGRPDPTAYGQVKIPKGTTTFIFWWHAIADLTSGAEHNNVFVKVVLTTDDGEIIQHISGNLTLDYTGVLGGSLPPQVVGGSLPPGQCGIYYDEMLFADGGQEPLTWSLLPDGASLPWYLELTHDGHIKGEIPVGYGPLMVNFVAECFDSNQFLPRVSSGNFQLYIGCDTPGECAPPPEILFSSLPDARVTVAYFYEMKAAGGEGILAWEITAGELPSGLIFNNGVITGAPDAGTENEYPLTIQVCDQCPIEIQCGTVEVVLVVEGEEPPGCDPAPVVTTASLPDGEENQSYSELLKSAGGHGDAVTWSIVDGTLPAGMQLTSAGVIHGTPVSGTGADNGKVYNFTVQVCDECPLGAQCGERELVLRIYEEPPPCAPAPIITTESPMTPATEEVEYYFQFVSSGGHGIKTWTLLSSLPTGLLFNPETGEVTGTPASETADDYSIEVEVSDSCHFGAQIDSGTFDLTVHESCGAPPVITQNTIWPASVGVEFNFQFAATGGVEPYTWAQIGGTPFADMGLDFTNGLINGVPTSGGVYDEINIEVTDSCFTGGQSSNKLYTFTISSGCAAPPSIVSTSMSPGAPGVEYNFTLDVTDGEGVLTYELVAPNNVLPTGLTFDEGTISGIPDAGTENDYILDFKVCDSCPTVQCDEETLTLSIIAPCADPPVITSTSPLPDAIAGVLYEYQFTADFGEGDLHWLIFFGLPSSLTINESGLLSGTPLIEDVALYNFDANVNDSCLLGIQYDIKAFALDVVLDGCLPPPEINELPSISIAAGMPVYYQFSAVNGHGNLTWTITDSTPALPGSVVMLPNGTLIGATDAGDFGTYYIDIQVCDECDDPSPQCDTFLGFELILDEATGCGAGPPIITETTIPTPVLDVAYNETLNATGGDGTLMWFMFGMPGGMQIDQYTGVITGMVNIVDEGTYHVVVSVIDLCAPVPQADSLYVVWDIY